MVIALILKAICEDHMQLDYPAVHILTLLCKGRCLETEPSVMGWKLCQTNSGRGSQFLQEDVKIVFAKKQHVKIINETIPHEPGTLQSRNDWSVITILKSHPFQVLV